MIINWHCRNCNDKGEQVIWAKDLPWKPGEDFLDLLIKKIEHKCDNPNVGIKVEVNNANSDASNSTRT